MLGINQINELVERLHQINKLAKEHDYWSSNLQKATEIINKIAELSEVK